MAPPADAAPAQGAPAAALLKGAALLAGLLALGYALRLLGAGLLTHAAPTWQGAAALAAAGALLSAAGVPRQAVAFACGYAFGAWQGTALALLAQMLGCIADLYLARTIARRWATRRIAGRAARLHNLLLAKPFTASLTLRLLPVGNNLALNLLAGVAGIPVWPFLAATLLGYIPQTLVFALAGSGTHIDQAYQIALAAALFGGSAIAGLILLRASKVGGDEPSPPNPPSSLQ